MSEHVKDYMTLGQCYDHFNSKLFDGALPGCVLSFESKGQQFGYYRKNGYLERNTGETRDEIALNPKHFLTNSGDGELLQTLVHEMVHQWQEHFGSPSKRTYHNHEWSRMMESIGLMPSDTGKPGGKRVGQKMADYVIKGARFDKVTSLLLKKKQIISYYKTETVLAAMSEPGTILHTDETYQTIADEAETILVDIVGSVETSSSGSDNTPPKPTPSKVKYTCPSCEANAWGKPHLSLLCGNCIQNGKHIAFSRVQSY